MHMNKPNVKIGVINGTTITSCAFQPECAIRGPVADIAWAVCDSQHLNCTFIYYDKSDHGDADENGTGNGMIGAVQRGEFDTSLPVFTPTYRRFGAVDFSNPYITSDYFIITRALDNDYKKVDYSILTAFHWKTWCVFAVALVLISIYIIVLSRKSDKNFADKKRYSKRQIVNAIVNNCVWLLTSEFSDKILVTVTIRLCITVWSFCAIVMSSAYTSKLFSNKVAKMNNLPFTDFETFVECLEENRCSLIDSTLASSYMQFLTGPEHNLGRRILETFEKSQPIIKPRSEIPSYIVEQRHVYMVTIASRIAYYGFLKTCTECQFYAIEAPYKETWAWPVRKNSPLLAILNKGSVPFREQGLIEPLSAKYNKPIGLDRSDTVQRSDFDSSMGVSVYFCGVGFVIAFATFLFEVMVYNCFVKK